MLSVLLKSRQRSDIGITWDFWWRGKHNESCKVLRGRTCVCTPGHGVMPRCPITSNPLFFIESDGCSQWLSWGLWFFLHIFYFLLFKRYLRLCDLQQKYTWHSNSSFQWGNAWVKKGLFELNIEYLKLLRALTVTPFVHFERWGLFVNWPQHLLVSFIGGMAS